MRTISIETLPELQARGVEDPRRYLFLKTETGLVAFDEKASVEELVKKLHPDAAITIEPLGGVLNDVYLLTVGGQRFVAKKFTDWHSFKWFILNLVSLGTKNFTLSGKARLSNEYGLSEYLSEHGVSVPAIQHVSMPDRIIIKEYIEGVPATELVRKIASASLLNDRQIEMSRALGEYIAAVHKLEVAIGDSKPENFQSSDGRIYLLDLEQGGRPGDKSWDIAEFLYYSGHYGLTGILKGGFGEFVKYFVDGYMKNGDASVLRNAGSLKYSKVFSIWTPPPIILEVTQALRNARPA
jgi:tRNA A-37 threonylcarbamoyl transferase component Bud32